MPYTRSAAWRREEAAPTSARRPRLSSPRRGDRPSHRERRRARRSTRGSRGPQHHQAVGRPGSTTRRRKELWRPTAAASRLKGRLGDGGRASLRYRITTEKTVPSRITPKPSTATRSDAAARSCDPRPELHELHGKKHRSVDGGAVLCIRSRTPVPSTSRPSQRVRASLRTPVQPLRPLHAHRGCRFHLPSRREQRDEQQRDPPAPHLLTGDPRGTR